MKRTDVLSRLSSYLDACEQAGRSIRASDLMCIVQKEGMVPVSRQSVAWSHPAIIYKFEEDITPQEWERAKKDARRCED